MNSGIAPENPVVFDSPAHMRVQLRESNVRFPEVAVPPDADTLKPE